MASPRLSESTGAKVILEYWRSIPLPNMLLVGFWTLGTQSYCLASVSSFITLLDVNKIFTSSEHYSYTASVYRLGDKATFFTPNFQPLCFAPELAVPV